MKNELDQNKVSIFSKYANNCLYFAINMKLKDIFTKNGLLINNSILKSVQTKNIDNIVSDLSSDVNDNVDHLKEIDSSIKFIKTINDAFTFSLLNANEKEFGFKVCRIFYIDIFDLDPKYPNDISGIQEVSYKNSISHLNSSVFTYFYNMEIEIVKIRDNDLETPIKITIPFIPVRENDICKILLLKSSFKLSLMSSIPNIEDDIELIDIDSGFTSKISSIVINNLNEYDLRFAGIISEVEKYGYTYRKEDDVDKAIRLYNFDSKYLDKIRINRVLPLVKLDDDKVMSVLCTNGKVYKEVPYEEYKNDKSYRAIVIKDDYLTAINVYTNTDELIPNGSILYKVNHIKEFRDDYSLRDVHAYVRSSESEQVINGLIYIDFDNYTTFSESLEDYDDEFIKDDLKNVQKISKPAYAAYKALVKTGKGILKAISRTRLEITYLKYINEFIDSFFNFLAIIIPSAALMVLVGPAIALLFAVMTAVYKLPSDKKMDFDEKEIQKVDKYLDKKIEALEDKKKEYSDNNMRRSANRTQNVINELKIKKLRIRNKREMRV